jgi:glutamate synthase (NADPH/NADH) small chain
MTEMNAVMTKTPELKVKPQVSVNRERCVGCQDCITRCPTSALSMDVKEWVAAVDNTLCVGCRQCRRTCPVSAISVEGPVEVSGRAHFTLHAGPIESGNVDEVRPGFSGSAEAVKEAERCLNCPDPTCVRGCPAHNDIPGFIEAIRNQDLDRAQTIISKTSCLPDVCSRVCDWSTQCEGACNWALASSQPVAIGKLERFVTDNSPVPPIRGMSQRGKGLSVGIVGSGPAGIAAAAELASAGAAVTVYERESTPGGVLQWGIPSYVLPDGVTQRPIRSLIESGVQLRSNTTITPELMTGLLKQHDAVIAASGALVPEHPAIPGLEFDGVVDSTSFLMNAKRALAEGTTLAKVHDARVIVLGGSNTALDVARTTVRLGGRPIIVHRREERFSRARPDEIAEAKSEGVEFRFATNIVRLEGENGVLKRAVLVPTAGSGADSVPTDVRGSQTAVGVDMVVLATGYGVDHSYSGLFGHVPVTQPSSDRLFPDRRWVASGIMAGDGVGKLAWQREYGLRASRSPKHERLWVVGDALSGSSTVVGAMAQGRLAAQSVLEKLPRRSKV